MATTPCHSYLLITFLMIGLCFFSITAKTDGFRSDSHSRLKQAASHLLRAKRSVPISSNNDEINEKLDSYFEKHGLKRTLFSDMNHFETMRTFSTLYEKILREMMTDLRAVRNYEKLLMMRSDKLSPNNPNDEAKATGSNGRHSTPHIIKKLADSLAEEEPLNYGILNANTADAAILIPLDQKKAQLLKILLERKELTNIEKMIEVDSK